MFASLMFFGGAVAHGTTSPNGIHYQGQILSTATNAPLEAASVTFTFQIVSPGAESCVLYEETQTLNMTNSNGVFDLIVGQGTPTSGGGSNNPAVVLTLAQVFNNTGTLTGLHCGTGTTYSPLTGQGRKLTVKFNDGTTTSTLASALNINSVPYALYCDSLQGKAPADLVQVNNSTAAVTQANVESIFASSSAVTELLALINGTSTQYMSSSANAGAALPSYSSGGGTPASAVEGSLWYNSSTHTLQYKDNSGVKTVSTGAGGTLAVGSGGTGTTTGSITGTGALTFAAGGSNQNVTLTPSGTGYTLLNGNVGVSNASPAEALDVTGNVRVTGQMYNPSQTSSANSPLTWDPNSGAVMNWSTGVQTNVTVNVWNMKDGGVYSLGIRGTGVGTTTINCYSDAGTTALTTSMLPTNMNRAANASIYSIQRMGNYCYVSWSTGWP